MILHLGTHPVDQSVVDLLDMFVHIVAVKRKQTMTTAQQTSEVGGFDSAAIEAIFAAFRASSARLSTAATLCYYVLAARERNLGLPSSTLHTAPVGTVLAMLPASSRLLAPLRKLTAVIAPQFLVSGAVLGKLGAEDGAGSVERPLRSTKLLSALVVKTVLQEAGERPARAISVLDTLASVDPVESVRGAPGVMAALLPSMEGRGVMQEAVFARFQRLWSRWAVAEGWWLTLETARLMLDAPRLTHDVLLADPLRMLGGINRRVFRSPALVEIVLGMLNRVLAGVRARFDFEAPQSRDGDEMRALQLAQMAAVTQLLLETVLVDVRSDAVRSQIGAFIHELYVDSPELVRLVHVQGYDPALLPFAVKYIPGMHVCTDFLAMMVTLPNVQEFAVRLCGLLALQYPVQATLTVCGHVLAALRATTRATGRSARPVRVQDVPLFKSSSLATALADADLGMEHPLAESFVRASLPTLVEICTAFPMLREEVCDVLVDFSSAPLTRSLKKELHDSFRELASSIA